MWLAPFSDLSAFAPISGCGFLLIRSIRTRATLAYLPYTSQDHLPRGSTTHSGLGPPSPVINRNTVHRLPTSEDQLESTDKNLTDTERGNQQAHAENLERAHALIQFEWKNGRGIRKQTVSECQMSRTNSFRCSPCSKDFLLFLPPPPFPPSSSSPHPVSLSINTGNKHRLSKRPGNLENFPHLVRRN